MKTFFSSCRVYVYIALLIPFQLFASNGHHEQSDMVHLMAVLVLQIGIIIFAARLGGKFASRLHLPPVLGELAVGILIGHSLLGGIPLPAFPDGRFAAPPNAALPITPELYGIATIASIILLFFAGLETDLNLLLRFSIAGVAIGIGGVIGSFFAGSFIGIFFLHMDFFDPRCLFLGVISTATSVGITVRILSEKKRMDSPEGVTIIAAAVIDDVIGIILLAIISGVTMSGIEAAGHGVNVKEISLVGIKAIGVWLGCTLLGLWGAKYLSQFLKSYKNITIISMMALGCALLLAGFFEMAGLAMIIGAYVVGLSLSTTDLKYVLQETLEPLYAFFVPIFFTVTGMLVDIQQLLNPQVLMLGGIYSLAAFVGKLIGCGIPSRSLGFNLLGTIRIGLGMAPRGEVALIIAGIGLSYGVLDQQILSISVIMILATTMLAPLFSASLTDKRGTIKEIQTHTTVTTPFTFPSIELTDLLEQRIIDYFRQEGSFVHMIESDDIHRLYQIRKETTFLTLDLSEMTIAFDSTIDDVPYVKTLVYETLVTLHNTINKLKHVAKPESLKKEVMQTSGQMKFDMTKILQPQNVILELAGTTKKEIIEELVDILDKNSKLIGRAQAFDSVWERELTMSTGMQYGVAIPHGKAECVGPIVVAIGFKHDGIDFEALDGEPSHVFVLVISSPTTTGPHIQFLAALGALFKGPEVKYALLACRTKEEVCNIFTSQSNNP